MIRISLALQDVAVRGRVKSDVVLRLMIELQLLKLRIREIPKFQTPSRGFEQRGAARRDFRQGTLGQRVACPERQQIFLLHAQQVRAEEREQGLTLLDLLPGGVHENLLDPATGLDVNVHQTSLIDRHPAHNAESFVEGAKLGRGGRDSHQLLPRRTDLNASRRKRGRRTLGGVNRHELHAVRRDPGFVRVIGGVHGILVIENLRLRGLCLVRSFGLLRGPEGWGEAAMLGAEARARFTSQRQRSRENRQNGGTG